MALRSKKNIYHIIMTSRGKQLHDLYWTDTWEKVSKKYNEMLKENEKVIFPTKKIKISGTFYDANYELVIIKTKHESDEDENLIRSDNGKFEPYVSSDEDWIVCDRHSWDIEETFNVYGYHPIYQRKNIEWIFNEFLLKDSKDKYKFKEVNILYNKVIFNEAGNLNMVLCNDRSDAIRMNNILEKMAKKHKLKYVIFKGLVEKRKDIIDWYHRIEKWTGWNYLKVKRSSLRP